MSVGLSVYELQLEYNSSSTLLHEWKVLEQMHTVETNLQLRLLFKNENIISDVAVTHTTFRINSCFSIIACTRIAFCIN